jgi:hypothetical protein
VVVRIALVGLPLHLQPSSGDCVTDWHEHVQDCFVSIFLPSLSFFMD